MNPGFSFPVSFGDVLGYAQTVEQILKEYAKSPESFRGITEKAAAFIGENYAEARERESIVSCWNHVSG